jgi:chromosome partitioning protein
MASEKPGAVQSVDEYDPEGRACAEIGAMWSTISELAHTFPRHA